MFRASCITVALILGILGTGLAQPISVDRVSQQVIGLLASKDMKGLSKHIHPVKGVRFSPYEYVEKDHRVFTAKEISDSRERVPTYNWGQYDGSGDPTVLTFPVYYDQFVYDRDYAKAKVVGSKNTTLGRGNTINNIASFYPGSVFIEYHFPSTPKLKDFDWNSLWLVFEQLKGTWYLVGIVHGAWTI